MRDTAYAWLYLLPPVILIVGIALATVLWTTTRSYRKRQSRIAEADRVRAAQIAEHAARVEAKRKRKVKFEDGPAKHLYVNESTGEMLETYEELEVPGWRRV